MEIKVSVEAYEDLKRIAKQMKEIDEFKDIDEKLIVRLLAVTFVLSRIRERKRVQGFLKDIEKEKLLFSTLGHIKNAIHNFDQFKRCVTKEDLEWWLGDIENFLKNIDKAIEKWFGDLK